MRANYWAHSSCSFVKVDILSGIEPWNLLLEMRLEKMQTFSMSNLFILLNVLKGIDFVKSFMYLLFDSHVLYNQVMITHNIW